MNPICDLAPAATRGDRLPVAWAAAFAGVASLLLWGAMASGVWLVV